MNNIKLLELVSNHFPAPIAFNYSQMVGAETPERRIMHMPNLADAIIRYLAVVAASDYMQSPAHQRVHLHEKGKECPHPLCQAFHTGRTTIGKFVGLLRGCVEGLTRDRMQPFMPDLILFYEKHNDKIEELKDFRNKEWGHPGGTAPTGFYEELYQAYKPKFDAVLQKLSFLAQYPLIAPALSQGSTEGKIDHTCYWCMGEDLWFKATHHLTCRYNLVKHNLYIYDPKTDVLLNLSPLMVFLPWESDQRLHIFFIEEVKRVGEVKYIDLQEKHKETPRLGAQEFARKTGVDIKRIPEEFRPEEVSVSRSRVPEISILPQPRREISLPYATIGDEIQVALHLVNTGTDTAVGVTFEEQLPEGLKLTRGKTEIGPETIEPGLPREISYTVKAEQEGEYLLPATLIRYRDESGNEYSTPVPAETILVELSYQSELVGRDEELTKLKKWLTAAKVGSGRLVLIAGEAGAGKTRLAEELCSLALTQGATVFGGGCADKGTVPFYPFLRARQMFMQGSRLAQSDDELFGDQTTSARGIGMPRPSDIRSSGIGRAGSGVGGHETERFSQAEGISSRLIGMARKELVVFLLDDLQWADRDSMVLILDILASITSLHFLLLVTYRIEEVDEQLRDALGRMRRHRDVCHEIELGRLAGPDCESMIVNILGAPADRRLAERVYTECQGNPFLLVEILKILRENGYIRKLDEIWTPVQDLETINIPSAVYEVILKRLERLSREHRDLLEFASVEGVVFTVDEAFTKGFRVVSRQETNVWTLRRELGWLERVHRIIRARETEADRFEFDHAKIREALYKGLKRADLVFYHKTIAQCMEEDYLESGESDEALFEMADHFYKGEVWEKAAEYFIKAGETSCNMGAYATAERNFDLAEQALAKARPTHERRIALKVDLLIGRAELDVVRGQWLSRQETLKACLEEARNLGDKRPYVKLLIFLAQSSQATRELVQSRALTDEAVTLSSQYELKKELASALGCSAWLHDHFGDYNNALKEYNEALRIIRELGEPVLEVQALRDIASVEGNVGNHARALALNREALSISQLHRLKGEEGILMRYIGMSYKAMENWKAAFQWYENSLRVRREIGDLRGEAFTLSEIGDILSNMGRRGEAIESYQKAIELARQIGERPVECGMMCDLSSLYREMGDYPRAIEILRDALSIAEQIPEDRVMECSTLRRLGRAEKGRGAREQALQYFNRALDLARTHGLKHEEALSLSALGEYFESLKEYEEAGRYYQLALEVDQASGDKKNAASDLNKLGDVYSAQGNNEQAMSCYQQALQLKREAKDLLGETLTLRNIARLHAKLKAYDDSIQVYQEAMSKDHELGNKTGEVNCLRGLAELYEEMEKPKEALSCYQQCLLIREETGDVQGQSYYHTKIAEILEQSKEFGLALQHHEAALNIDRTLGKKRSMAADLQNIGRMYRKLHDWEHALTYYQEALATYQETGTRWGIRDTLTGIGLTYQAMGQPRKAAESLQGALDIDREIGDEDIVSQDLRDLGGVYLEGKMPVEALSCFEEALSLARRFANNRLQSYLLLRIAECHSALKRYDLALASQQEALSIDRGENDRQNETVDLLAIATTYLEIGQLDEALTYATQSLHLRREINDRRGESYCLSKIAHIHQEQGEFEKALEYHQQALTIDREAGDKAAEAADLANIAGVHRSMGNDEEALRYQAEALAIRSEAQDIRGQARSLHSMARVFLEREEIPKAVEYYQQAYGMYAQVNDLVGQGNTKLWLGFCFLESKDYQAAREQLQQALLLCERAQDSEGQISALLAMADASLVDDPSAAVELTQKALEIGELRGDLQSQLRVYQRFAKLLRQQKNIDGALEAYLKAVAIARRLGEKEAETNCCTALCNLYEERGNTAESQKWIERAIEIDRELGNHEYLVGDNVRLSELLLAQGDREGAVHCLESALESARHTQDPRALANVCWRLGSLLLALDRYEVAWDHLLEALSVAEQAGFKDAMQHSLIMLCRTSVALGKVAQAREYGDRCLALARETNTTDLAIDAGLELSTIHIGLGNLEAAEEQLMGTLELCQSVNDRRSEAVACTRLGNLYRRMGNMQKARTYIEKALVLDRQLSNKRWEAEDLRGFARTYAAEDLQMAEAYYRPAITLYEELEDLRGKGEVLEELAGLYLKHGELEQAREYAEQALQLYKDLSETEKESLCLTLLADVCAEMADLDAAILYSRSALGLDTQLNKPSWAAVSSLNLADLLVRVGQQAEAIQLLEQAHTIYVKLRDFRKASKVSYRIYDITEKWKARN
jgi:uncharacterized repeat protein (TIGR01451 family)